MSRSGGHGTAPENRLLCSHKQVIVCDPVQGILPAGSYRHHRGSVLLQDPGNLGTIVRTGEGAGVTGIIIGSGTADIYAPKTVRATMGSIYRVPVICAEDLVEAVGRLRGGGVHTYAAHLQGKNYYDGFSFREATAFLIGNEGAGLSPQLAEAAEGRVRIPMEGQLESLNAAVAASLLMYEAHRQRFALK